MQICNVNCISYKYDVVDVIGVAKGEPEGPGTPNPIQLKIIEDTTCMHYACTAHQADRTEQSLQHRT